MPSLSSKQLAILGGAVVIVLLVIGAFMFGIRTDKTPPSVFLTVWGTDVPDNFEPLAQAYMKLRTNVQVTYKYIDPKKYDQDLLTALAAGQGPDVFFVRSHNLPTDLISPSPEKQITLAKVREVFPKVVEQDFASNGKVNALPLYIDTLALIYNRDIFDKVGVVSPPADWNDFEGLVKDLRVLNDQGQVEKSGAAIGGTSKTIYNASDILELLILQNLPKGEVDMVDNAMGQAVFANKAPGIQAFDFYTQFGDSGSAYFTWEDAGSNSLESFASGKTIMLLDYNEKLQALKAKSPFLDISVSPAPQVNTDSPLNYADYQGLTVSKQAKDQAWAWDFVVQATTNEDLSSNYLKVTNRPPALRNLIGKTLNKAEMGVFARQALTARSWIAKDHDKAKDAFNSAIGKVISGGTDSRTALYQAQNQISSLLKVTR